MTSIYNILNCLDKSQLQVLCAALIQEEKLDVQFLVSKLQKSALYKKQNVECEIKTLIEKISSEQCTLLDIGNFIKLVMEKEVISKLFPIAMKLKCVMIVPDDIYEKNNLQKVGVVDEILELCNKKIVDIETKEFLNYVLNTCKKLISGNADLLKY